MITEKVNKYPLSVSEVKIRLVDGSEDGLIGWASCVINHGLFLNNIAVRRSLEGRIVLSFPSKKSNNALKYFYFNPISKEASETINAAIINKLTLV